MNELELILLAKEIRRIYEEEDQSPFPYEGCRVLMGEFPDECGLLIPELDSYLANIASHSVGGRRLFKWSEEELQKSYSRLSFNFFDWQPQYAKFQRLITASNTPDLFEKLMLYEQLRKQLLILISELIRLHEEES